jgi:hypothetical protein
MNLIASLAYFLYFSVWSIKDFDSFGSSLILLNIKKISFINY